MGFFRRGRTANQPPPAPAGSAPSALSPSATAASPDDHLQHLPGVDLHYHTWGAPAAGRAILLVHAQTANYKQWALLGPQLAAAGAYVVAPDLRGRGLSSKPAHGYGIAFHAADMVNLLDALELDAVDVVGHSLGGAIVMYMAAVYPARVRKLVIVDAGGKVPEDSQQAIGASVARLGTVYPSLDAFLGLMRQLPMITEWSPFWEDFFRYDAEVRADGTVVSRVPRAAIVEDVLALGLTRTEVLPDLIRQPTLLLRSTFGLLGPDRGFILTREEAERVHDVIAGCQLVEIEGTNHYTMLAAPAFAEAVGRFLAAGE
jgi:pimeloyl-ACP methyl ester carboxylesterase